VIITRLYWLCVLVFSEQGIHFIIVNICVLVVASTPERQKMVVVQGVELVVEQVFVWGGIYSFSIESRKNTQQRIIPSFIRI